MSWDELSKKKQVPCPFAFNESGTTSDHAFDSYVHPKSSIVRNILPVVTEAARGLLHQTAWPYFKDLRESKTAFGALVATYFFGRIFSLSPPGYLNDELSYANVLVIAAVIQAFKNLIYVLLPYLTLLCMSSFIVGFSSVSTSFERAHIAKAIPHSSKTEHFSFLSGIQFIGISSASIRRRSDKTSERNLLPYSPHWIHISSVYPICIVFGPYSFCETIFHQFGTHIVAL